MSRRSHQTESPALTLILEQLPKLSVAELSVVRQRLAFLRTMAGQGPFDVNEHIVIDAITSVLRDNGVSATLEQFTSSSSRSSFAEKVPGLYAYLETVSTNRNHQRAVLRVGVELIYAHLTNVGIPVGARTLMNHIHRVPEFINVAFPGYARAGMLSWVTSRFRKGTNDKEHPN